MDDDIKRIECKIENLEGSINEIKEALSKAFEREQSQWKQVFDAVDMNFKEIRDYANDTFLHADTFWEYRKKDNDLNQASFEVHWHKLLNFFIKKVITKRLKIL